MVYKQVNFKEEIATLSKCKIIAFVGYFEQRYINVVFERPEGVIVRERYYFSNTNYYSKFNKKLRELYNECSD